MSALDVQRVKGQLEVNAAQHAAYGEMLGALQALPSDQSNQVRADVLRHQMLDLSSLMREMERDRDDIMERAARDGVTEADLA